MNDIMLRSEHCAILKSTQERYDADLQRYKSSHRLGGFMLGMPVGYVLGIGTALLALYALVSV